MKRLTFGIAAVLFIALISGCASTSMLPQTADEVIFNGGKEGKTGWSAYREEAFFNDTDKALAIQAAKAGLGDAGFALKHVNKTEGVVFGEHGMTMHDWNVVAGVYVKEEDKDSRVVVLVEGSKDFGLPGDATGGAWTGKILKGMRSYIESVKN